MRTAALLSVASIVAVAQSQGTAAPVVNNNPIGASFVATLPEKANSALRGSVYATSGANGTGVQFSVSLSGLPETGGPFMYHIHEKPVPADGNCTGTGAHQDPYKRSETPPCDPSTPANCQTGDLSGKYGNFTGNSFSAHYLDEYTSTNPADKAYFGNLSIVVHLANKTRIGCANFTTTNTSHHGPGPVISGAPNATALPNGTIPHTLIPTSTFGASGGASTPSGTGKPSTPTGTGVASSVGVTWGSSVLVAGLMALLL